jgi:hypothetical protein
VYGRDFLRRNMLYVPGVVAQPAGDGDVMVDVAVKGTRLPTDERVLAEGVVVVACRDDGTRSGEAGSGRAVQVRVDEVGVNDVGLNAAQVSRQPPDYCQIEVVVDRERGGVDVQGLPTSQIGWLGMARLNENEHVDFNASCLEAGQKGQQMALRTGDSGDFADVGNTHQNGFQDL